MNPDAYEPYISSGTLMGPSSVRILAELLEEDADCFGPDDEILDLGCGTGLTSLVLARETGARICAADLWVPPEENADRFAVWGVGRQIAPVRADANHLPFEEGRFAGLFSMDAYHYFGGEAGFFEDRILPFLKEGSSVRIGVPGIRDEFSGRSAELLSDWLGKDARMFRSPAEWKEILRGSGRSVRTWEMQCFSDAWDEWLSSDNEYAKRDAQFFNSVIRPYTCFVGIRLGLGAPVGA